MFIPIGDSPNPPGTPWVTYLLIGANVLAFILLLPLSGQAPDPSDPALRLYLDTMVRERGLTATQIGPFLRQLSAYDLFTFEHGFKPAAPTATDIFTSMFLHGGLLHLLGNMLFLWIYGDNVEHRLGKLGFLLAYLATGVAACLGDGFLRMGSAIPSVGASGAISGVLGFYFLWFPRNRVRVWVFLFPFFANIIEMRARLVLGFYIIFQNILPVLLTGGSGGVSHGAHLGGFLAGSVGAFLLDKLWLARPERDLRRQRPTSQSTDAPLGAGGSEAFLEALDTDRWAQAAEWYFATPHAATRQLISPTDKVRLGDLLQANGHPRAALAAYQRALADHPRGPGRALAHIGSARVLMTSLGNPTGAYQHLYAALEEDPTAEETVLARQLLSTLAGMVRTLPGKLPN